tara:strand:+ start:7545 stop:8006 length:462 start_codon:yes stop_codon:yes gene_type:complete
MPNNEERSAFNVNADVQHRRFKAGIGHVGSYQVAGRPFLTGSDITTGQKWLGIHFPAVTKAITVISSGSGDLRVSFSQPYDGSDIQPCMSIHRNYITLNSNEDSITLNVKCRDIYVSLADPSVAGAFELSAELTGIDDGLQLSGNVGVSYGEQ